MQGSVFYPIKSHHDVNLCSWSHVHSQNFAIRDADNFSQTAIIIGDFDK